MDNRELIERLRRDLGMSLYATPADLWSEVAHQRRFAADALERAEAELKAMREGTDKAIKDVVADLGKANAELAKYRNAPVAGHRYEFANGGAVVGQYRIEAGQWPVDDKPTAIHELIIRPEAP